MTLPFLKWVGGKRKLLKQLLPLLPPDVQERRYFEPFVGGGAMFFELQPKRAVLADSNEELINTYIVLRDQPAQLIAMLKVLASQYSKKHYYTTRAIFNSKPLNLVWRAAAFIYLNKTCFNGLWRVNKAGQFNVPWGKYKNPTICDKDALLAAHQALNGFGVATSVQGFHELPVRAMENAFIYADPPYEPVSKTAKFATYTAGGFTQADQQELRDVLVDCHHFGAKIMVSNSDTPFIRKLYADWRIDVIQAARAVNCKGDKRGAVNELVIKNY